MKHSVKSERFKNLSADRKRIERGLLIAIVDVCAVVLATYGSLWMRYDFSFNAIERKFLLNVTKALPFNIISVLVIFFFLLTPADNKQEDYHNRGCRGNGCKQHRLHAVARL